MNRRHVIFASIVAGLSAGAARADAPAPRVIRRVAVAPREAVVFDGAEASVAASVDHGIPIVSATINGQALQWGIDTGAGAPVSLEITRAESLGLSKIGEAHAGDPSGRNLLVLPIYGGADVSLGGVTFRNITVLGREGAIRPYLDGILGLDLFQNHLLRLDYGRGEVRLSQAELPAADGLAVHEYAPARRLVELALTVGAQTLVTHLDTGNTVAPLILPAEAAVHAPRKGGPRRIGTAHTINNAIDMFEIDLDAPVKLDNQVLPLRTACYPSAADAANLGSLAFAGGAVAIDQKNRRIAIEMRG